MNALSSYGWPDAKTMIPELLRGAPSTRRVLDKYGLRGCGGVWGPHESLERFSHAHDVPLEQLLEELRDAARRDPAEALREPTRDEQLADTIYRPFFRAAILVTLTLGAAWGVILLLRIAWTQAFASATLHEVNAHGHAQIFGWVGLFVMGFAYQAVPRFKHIDLAHPRLACASWWLMLVGLIARSVMEPLGQWQTWAAGLAVAASVVEVAAIALFLLVIGATLQRSLRRLEIFDYYMLAATVWFFIQGVWEAVYLAATFRAIDHDHLLDLIATWQGPLREVQIHGFAMLMILGVSQRFFHPFYGLPAPDRRISRWALVALNAAILGETAGLILMRTAGHAWALLWYGSVLTLAFSVVRLVGSWHLFSRPEESDRSLKFLRAAYAWLFVALAMTVLAPVYQFGILPWLSPDSHASRIGFSHAYYGAIRHASTVGFVSLMIVGVAAKVVPTLHGLDVRRMGGLWWPFVLVNLGCGLRVVFQTLTDFTPAAFPVAGISGLLELSGLSIWGAHLLWIMAGRGPVEEPSEKSLPIVHATGSANACCHVGESGPADAICADHVVAEVLDRHPALVDVFIAHGFQPLTNPILRRTIGRRTTIAAACRRLDVPLESFLEELNAATCR